MPFDKLRALSLSKRPLASTGWGVADFPAWMREHWGGVRASLEAGRYRPAPVRRVEIDKPGGGKRPLGIPTVLDRLIQQAIAQVLSNKVDETFHPRSYGFRPGRSAHQAVRQMQADLKEGYAFAVDLDVEKFFDRVNHDVLMRLLRRRIPDARVRRLIGQYLRSGVQLAEGKIEPTREGVPQGGPLSPLLANILLDVLDWELDRRGHRFVRYADDFIILVKSERAAHRVHGSIRRWLEEKLKLRVNASKSRVCRTAEAEYLGFQVKQKSFRASAEAVAGFRHKIKQLTGRSWGVSMRHRIGKLNAYVRGWCGYFALGLKWREVEAWDKWLRRRLRMCWWKRWRNPRRRVSELMKLGCDRTRAVRAASSRGSFWRQSRTYAAQLGMSNEWLKNQGIISLSESWIAVHHPGRGRPEPACAEQVNLWGW